MFSEVASTPGAAFDPIIVSEEGSTCRDVQTIIADCRSKTMETEQL